jgi:hypothetical protein
VLLCSRLLYNKSINEITTLNLFFIGFQMAVELYGLAQFSPVFGVYRDIILSSSHITASSDLSE